jgi:hypothetical protein
MRGTRLLVRSIRLVTLMVLEDMITLHGKEVVKVPTPCQHLLQDLVSSVYACMPVPYYSLTGSCRLAQLSLRPSPYPQERMSSN